MTSRSSQDDPDLFIYRFVCNCFRNVVGCQTAFETAEPHSRRVRLRQFELQFDAYSGQFLLSVHRPSRNVCMLLARRLERA